jgi:hypothetical protein
VGLTGVIPNQQNGYGTLAFFISGIQNGGSAATPEPDGFALIDPDDLVIEFISYEGSFTAQSSSAAGLTSTDIAISQEPGPAVGLTLQLGGAGVDRPDFSWQTTAQTATPNAVNINQSFVVDSGGASGVIVR